MGRHPSRSGPRPYKTREERRDEIVSATLAILTERGLHAWKTAELARRVGVSEPTLFRHFKNKDEILTAAAQRATGLVRARIRADLEGAAPWEQVHCLVLSVLRAVEETGGAPIIVLAGQLSGAAPGIRRQIRGTLRAFRSRLVEVFEAGQLESGPDASPDVLADLTIAIVQSCALRWVASAGKFSMRARAEAMLQALGGACVPEAPQSVRRPPR